MPVPRPTAMCFGGARMDQMYITSASTGLSDEQMKGRRSLFRIAVRTLSNPACRLPDPRLCLRLGKYRLIMQQFACRHHRRRVIGSSTAFFLASQPGFRAPSPW